MKKYIQTIVGIIALLLIGFGTYLIYTAKTMSVSVGLGALAYWVWGCIFLLSGFVVFGVFF